MSTAPVDITPLRPALRSGALLLTANQRLARAVEQAWGAELAAAGHRTWERPRVHALEHWFAEQWQRLRDTAFEPALAGVPASAAVEQRLWHQVIAEGTEILDGEVATFARLAHTARQLLERWDLDAAAIAGGHRGSQLFAAWLPRWRAAMAARGLLTREQSLEALIAGRAAGVLEDAGTAHLVGFAALPPRHRRTLEALCSDPVFHQPRARDNAARLVRAADPDAELAAAVDWAADQLHSHPQRRIAIVIPDLGAVRDRAERLLRDVLDPLHCLPHTAWAPPPGNVSAGQPLADLPLPRTALRLLAVASTPLPWGAVCALLHDPHWGDAEAEFGVRARAELELREYGGVTPGAAELRRALTAAEQRLQCPGLVTRRLQNAAELHRRAPARAGFGRWVQQFAGYLQCLGWPGQRTLDSGEFQQLQHWGTLLERFAELGISGEALDWAEALSALRQLAAATPFQPRVPESRLQILGMLEAAGLQFDALWVTGMTDNRWPEPLDPHPLLPPALQRRLAMPRAQAEHERQIAEHRLQELRAAAPEVIFSYPLRDGEVELQPFAALRGLPATAATDPAPHPLIASLTRARALQTIAWGDAPPCHGMNIGGGSALLRDQSAAPFNAFATWRLGARALPDPEPGLSRAERGELVHRALELFWAPLPDQSALQSLGDAGRQQGLRTAVADALDELARRRPELRGPRLRAVEAACLLRLLEAWLAVELGRPPFAVVARERRAEVDLAGLRVQLRIDRIDRLADGRLLLLDYKTGPVRAGGWDGDRPEDPQLPLYALAVREPLAGLALARVRVDERLGCGLAGIADVELSGCRALADHGLAGDWQGALTHWQDVLEALAREFLNGTATLCHYHSDSARRDPLMALNRLPELKDIQRITK